MTGLGFEPCTPNSASPVFC